MVKRRRHASDRGEEETDAVGQNEALTTQDGDIKEQNSDDVPQATTINDLPNEILLMILKKVDVKSQFTCRLVNQRIQKVVDGHNLIYCDKPKNCYYSKKDRYVSLFIGELESEEEVVALRKRLRKIQYPALLKSVTIDWNELWGQSTFNDSFLFGDLEGGVKYPYQLILKASKIGKRKPVTFVNSVFRAQELILDIKTGLNTSKIQKLIRKLCTTWYSEVVCPREYPLAQFMDAVRKINNKYRGGRYDGDFFPPRVGVVAESKDDLLQIIPQRSEKFIKICHLEVTIMDKEQASYFHQIFKKNAKCLKSLKITVSTAAGVKDKPLLSVCPMMISLEKLELVVVGPGEDEKGRMLPPLIKLRHMNDLQEDGFTKKTLFPSLKRLCIRPPVASDDEKWDEISRVYYKKFLFVRQPDEDSPLSKWSRRLESLELGFPPKGNNSKFGGNKYQRFCLELAKIFKVNKATDTNSGEEVDFYRFK